MYAVKSFQVTICLQHKRTVYYYHNQLAETARWTTPTVPRPPYHEHRVQHAEGRNSV